MVWTMAVLVASLAAQDQAEFDAASIKPNDSVRIGMFIDTGASGELTARNATLRDLIIFAFNVRSVQITGGPRWIDSEHYDVVARPPHDGDRSNERNRIRMRALLAERFQLVLHTETKAMPVYALVVAKNGPRLEVSKGDNAQRGIHGQRGSMTCTGVSMETLTKWGLAPRLATSCSIRPA